MKINFIIPGEPCGKGRPRFDRRTGRTYTPGKTRSYESYGRYEFVEQCGNARFPDGVPLKIVVTAYFKIPDRPTKQTKANMRFGVIRPVKRPDADNCLKAICDIGNDLIYKDDAQIVEATVRKFYADEPRVVVEIEEAAT